MRDGTANARGTCRRCHRGPERRRRLRGAAGGAGSRNSWGRSPGGRKDRRSGRERTGDAAVPGSESLRACANNLRGERGPCECRAPARSPPRAHSHSVPGRGERVGVRTAEAELQEQLASSRAPLSAPARVSGGQGHATPIVLASLAWVRVFVRNERDCVRGPLLEEGAVCRNLGA